MIINNEHPSLIITDIQTTAKTTYTLSKTYITPKCTLTHTNIHIMTLTHTSMVHTHTHTHTHIHTLGVLGRWAKGIYMFSAMIF